MPASDLFFADHALSARLEAAEAGQLEGLTRVVAERLPERGAAFLSLAGGCAAFLGPNVSVSRAAGLGMSGPVTPADLDALEALYRSRGAEARILVSPFAHPSLFEQLGDRGFRLVELDTILARLISGVESGVERSPAPAGALEVSATGTMDVRNTGEMNVRRAEVEEAAAWVEVSLRGFSGSDEPPPRDLAALFEVAFHVPSVFYFFATIGGAAAGTAGLRIHGSTAHFFATSTLPAARGRGVQAALIDHRLEVARARGCDLAFTATEAGSASQRNFERRGFRPVYSRALMTKRYD